MTPHVALRFALVLATAAAVQGLRAQVPPVGVRALVEHVTVAPGARTGVAVRLDVPAGWYIDWINPGSTGLPTTLTWRAPAGLSAGPTAWPFPERVEADREVSHVLRGTVYAVTPFRAEATARPGRYELRATLSWLLCSGNCVRQQSTLAVPLRIARGPATRSGEWAEVEATAHAFPVAGDGLTFRAVGEAGGVRLEIGGLQGAPPTGSAVTFFPTRQGRSAVVVPLRTAGGVVTVTLPEDFVEGALSSRLSGVLVGLLVRGGAVRSRALAVDVPLPAPER